MGRGRGLGKRIMEEPVRALEQRAPAGAYVSLIAEGGVRFLYETFGFRLTTPAYVGMHRTVSGAIPLRDRAVAVLDPSGSFLETESDAMGLTCWN